METTPLQDAALDWVARPRHLSLTDGALVLRGAGPDDVDGLARMHARCTMDTIFRRYLFAAPAVSRQWQTRLLTTTVALVAVDQDGHVRALGNIADLDGGGTAELGAPCRGHLPGPRTRDGMARHLAAAARLAGFRALRMDLLPSSTAAARTAARSARR